MLKYVNINNEARKILNISFLEYVICEMVYHLSNNPESIFPGWCYMSRNKMGEELGMKKRGLIYAIQRLEDKDLIIRSKLGHLKTTSKWYESTVVQKVHPPRAKSAPPPVQKVHPILIEDNNIDKEERKETPSLPLKSEKSAVREEMRRNDVATLKYDRKVFESLFDVMLGGRTHEVETIAMRLSHKDWKAIEKHLPGYVKRTCQTGSDGKQFRSTVRGYLKHQVWLNNPNPPEIDKTRIPKSNKVTQIPK